MSELSVDVKANTDAAVAQVKNLGSTFDDTASDMEKLVDAGHDLGKSNDDIARDLSKINGKPFDEVRRSVNQADDSLDDLDDSADGAKRSLDKIGDAGRDAGDSARRGMDHASEGVENFKEEAQQTARESAASFDGSAASIGDVFQEVAANAFAGFGPAGAAAGIAAASGLGVLFSAISAANEETEKGKQRVADWAQSFIDAGGTILTAGIQAARFQQIITDPTQFSEAEKNASDWGVSIETAVQALAGSQPAINEVTRSVEAQEAAVRRVAETNAASNDVRSQGLVGLTQEAVAADHGREALERLTGEIEAGSERAQLLSGYYENLINTTSGVTVEVDALGNSLYTLPGDVQVFVDAATGQASANVANFKGDVNGIPDTVTTTVVFQADTSQADAARARLQEQINVGLNVTVPRGMVIYD